MNALDDSGIYPQFTATQPAPGPDEAHGSKTLVFGPAALAALVAAACSLPAAGGKCGCPICRIMAAGAAARLWRRRFLISEGALFCLAIAYAWRWIVAA